MDVFTNYQVAEYEATRVEVLSLFPIQGDQTQAKKKMVLWCQAQAPKLREEAQKGINKVICLEFLEVECKRVGESYLPLEHFPQNQSIRNK